MLFPSPKFIEIIETGVKTVLTKAPNDTTCPAIAVIEKVINVDAAKIGSLYTTNCLLALVPIIDAFAGMVAPLTFATTGLGYDPERSPPAAPPRVSLTIGSHPSPDDTYKILFTTSMPNEGAW